MKVKRQAVKVTFASLLAAGLLSYCTGLVRPPRPYFSNTYMLLADHPPWPHWAPPHPQLDQFGQYLWFDDRDNVALLVLSERMIEDHDQTWLFGGSNTATVRLGDVRNQQMIKITRKRDTLFVVRRSGDLLAIPLPPGMSRTLSDRVSVRPDRPEDFDHLEQTLAAVDAATRERITKSLGDYTRPTTRTAPEAVEPGS